MQNIVNCNYEKISRVEPGSGSRRNLGSGIQILKIADKIKGFYLVGPF